MSAMSYIGVDKCGCVLAATVDNPEHAKYVRRDVLEFMKWGFVERVEVEEARRQLCCAPHKKGCPHPQQCPNRLEGA